MFSRKERGVGRKSAADESKPPVTGPAPADGFAFEQGEVLKKMCQCKT